MTFPTARSLPANLNRLRTMKPFRILIPCVAIAILGAICAHAQVDPWEFEVYPYATTPRGMGELETTNAIVTHGHQEPTVGTAKGTFASDRQWYNAYEVTYGLTDRIEVAAYVTLAQPNGHSLQWSGNKFRLRGRLFDPGVLPFDLGWYAEIETHKTPQFDDASREFEFRPIIEKDFDSVSLFVNPKFEKVLAGAGRHQGVEFGYAVGLQYRWNRRFSPGLEFYGGAGLIDQLDPLRDQQHYVFPTIWGELPGGLEYNVGLGFGLTRGSDPVIFKVNLELERYVGALFKKAPSESWFF